jgi:hypothetical protein
MSRGPGRWQRLILDELKSRDRFYLLELLPHGYRKAHHNALCRAAAKLADAGRIHLGGYWMSDRYHYQRAKLLCTRPGVDVSKRPDFNARRRLRNDG